MLRQVPSLQNEPELTRHPDGRDLAVFLEADDRVGNAGLESVELMQGGGDAV